MHRPNPWVHKCTLRHRQKPHGPRPPRGCLLAGHVLLGGSVEAARGKGIFDVPTASSSFIWICPDRSRIGRRPIIEPMPQQLLQPRSNPARPIVFVGPGEWLPWFFSEIGILLSSPMAGFRYAVNCGQSPVRFKVSKNFTLGTFKLASLKNNLLLSIGYTSGMFYA